MQRLLKRHFGIAPVPDSRATRLTPLAHENVPSTQSVSLEFVALEEHLESILGIDVEPTDVLIPQVGH
jgi:hypothetical protein